MRLLPLRRGDPAIGCHLGSNDRLTGFRPAGWSDDGIPVGRRLSDPVGALSERASSASLKDGSPPGRRAVRDGRFFCFRTKFFPPAAIFPVNR